jgi:prepilin-type N-terminal cleavage/methylation domain-containing protein
MTARPHLRDDPRTALRAADAFTLVELLVTMAILLIVMGGITQIYLAGANAEAREQRQFQAQEDGRVALDKLRIDVHCAGSATGGAAFSGTASPNGLYPSVVLTESGIGNCPAAGTTITWCTATSGGVTTLHRSVGGTCTAASQTWASYLTSASVFGPPEAFSHGLSRVHVDIEIDSLPSSPGDAYRLIDDLTMRNTLRS